MRKGWYFELDGPRRSGKTTKLKAQAEMNQGKRIAYIAPSTSALDDFDSTAVTFKTTNILLVDPVAFDLILVDDIHLIPDCKEAAQTWASVCGVIATITRNE